MFATRIVAIAAACLMAGGPAVAGPLLIAPTTVQFEPGRRSAVIEVTNQSADPVDLQFRAFAWTQQNGHERMEPATDMTVSPPITTVPAHGKQVFRILSSRPSSGPIERSYRLKLNELPRVTTSAVAITVEFSLPVFLTPPGAQAHVTAAGDADGIWIVNDGSRRLRLASLAVRGADGVEHDLTDARSSYVLAGASRRLAWPSGYRPTGAATLAGQGDTGPIDAPLATR